MERKVHTERTIFMGIAPGSTAESVCPPCGGSMSAQGQRATSAAVRLKSALLRWSQPVAATLYLRGKRWSVGWNGDFIKVLLRQRRRSYGIAGSVGNR